VKVESSFSYLEISAITVGHLYQVTCMQNYSFTLMTMEDLETVVRHVTTSLKKIFPDSSPGRLLKKVPMDLQDQLRKLTTSVEEQLNGTQGPCGGFSETYAALCDFNEFPCREEVKWVSRSWCSLGFLAPAEHPPPLSHRDVALAVAALSFNHWFTRISNRDSRVSPEVQEQILYMINRSPRLEEVCLESSGLRPDFAQRMACALRDHTGSVLHTINLSANPIEDKGVVALSQQLEKLPQTLTHLSLSKVSLSPKGVASLAQAFSLKSFSTSLHQLDLSGNAGCLCLFTFLSRENAVSYLDLSGTDCPLDTLFVSLSAGCCSKMAYLSLSRNTFSHRKAKEVTRSVRDFFSRSEELKYVGLAGTRLPADALRLMLQGLATNTHLTGLEVDLSSCEVCVIRHKHSVSISHLVLCLEGLESDMVTLILSIGRSHSIRHLALGRNFAMKSRALSDVLHRIVQLIQEEECPIESLSVSDSKLKTGTTILINSLGRNLSLTTIDISGNCIGDTGAKMLAKALLINTRLRTLVWDRNNVTAAGLTDVANALEK
uniref:CARMIL pleckstrin homology domain-containing protein n=1 Tax=Scleropages formosus TaxID=113540 RepID=A0A8C9V2C5_SCLFO